MNLKTRALILSILFITSSSWSGISLRVKAETLKSSISYTVKKTKEVKLRITEVPSFHGMIERNDDWSVKLPKIGSEIIAENIEDIEIEDSFGAKQILPAGSKFYAKIAAKEEAKSFWRKEKVKIAFYKVEIPGAQINFDSTDTNFDSQKNSKPIFNTLANIGKASLYGLGGAVAAPIAVFSITGLLGAGLLLNPYVIGGSSALGAGLGLAYGIKRKGDHFDISPGSDIRIDLPNNWQLQEIDKSLASNQPPDIHEDNPNFDLKILNVKKSKDSFGDKCIKVSFEYDNRTKEELHLSSFKLIDSMGRDYYPSIDNLSSSSISGLPTKGILELSFNSEFLKTRHELVVLRRIDQKRLASSAILLR